VLPVVAVLGYAYWAGRQDDEPDAPAPPPPPPGPPD
jgi:hypothetical protein